MNVELALVLDDGTELPWLSFTGEADPQAVTDALTTAAAALEPTDAEWADADLLWTVVDTMSALGLEAAAIDPERELGEGSVAALHATGDVDASAPLTGTGDDGLAASGSWNVKGSKGPFGAAGRPPRSKQVGYKKKQQAKKAPASNAAAASLEQAAAGRTSPDGAWDKKAKTSVFNREAANIGFVGNNGGDGGVEIHPKLGVRAFAYGGGVDQNPRSRAFKSVEKAMSWVESTVPAEEEKFG